MKWLIMFLLTTWGLLFAQPGSSSVAFYHYGIKKGLPDTRIISISQDSNGFIWLAGENSVFRFDGFEFKQYWNSENSNEKSLLNAEKITTLFADSEGKIWVGSNNGLSYYNFYQDRFVGPIDGWQRIRITDFSEDKYGNLWIGTDEGVARFNPETNETSWFTSKDTVKTQGNNFLPDQNIHQICWQSDSLIAVATLSNGLYFLNPVEKRTEAVGKYDDITPGDYTITEIQANENDIYLGTLFNGLIKVDARNNSTEKFSFDGFGVNVHHFSLEHAPDIWMTTNNGLIRFNEQTGNYRRFTNVPNDPLSMERTAVNYVFLDREENLWLSLGIRGVNYGVRNVPFTHLIMGNSAYSLEQKEVTAIQFDSEGSMWLGYESGVVEKHENYPLKRQKIPVHSATGRHGTIFTIFEDSKSRIWLGGWQSGLLKLNADGTAFEQPEIIARNYSEQLKSADVRGITEGPNGNIWVAIHGLGVGKYNPETKNIDVLRFNPDDPALGISNDFTYNLCFDSGDNLWVSSSHGVSRIKPSQNEFTTFVHDENNPNSLSNNSVNTVFCDSEGFTWAGTQNGLNVFIPGTENFRPVLADRNNSFRNISSIEQSHPGELWVSTQSGLMHVKYAWHLAEDSVHCSAEYYDRSDGLVSTNFFDRSSGKNSEGIIFFGGNEGVDMCFPQMVDNFSDTSPQTLISEISIYDQSVYSQAINKSGEIPQLKLKHDHQMISFRFTSIDFNNSGQQRYRYKLDGFNDQWVYPQNEQVAVYTNLSPGTYVFTVQSQAVNNKWPASEDFIRLIIKAPFWATGPFIIIASVFIVLLLYLAYRLRNRYLLARQQELEKMIDARTRELKDKNDQLDLANKTKSKFFSIISHDLRSPFSGLLGILELLTDNETELDAQKRKKLLESARQSADNIFNLLENLLIWSRAQMHKTTSLPRKDNVSKLLEKNIDLKNELLRNKTINLETNYPKQLEGYYDPNMIDTVIRNTLSNAIKFTHPGGKIKVSADRLSRHEIIIQIADSGVGLTDEERKSLFNIEKKSRSGTNGEKGTGLGLIISREFIKQNHGKIWASSNKPKGTILNFTLPARKM